MLVTLYIVLLIAGSPHANLNQNNLKYGTDNNRISTQIQEPTTPPQSPNKNSGQAEKIVLLVCNRACAGQQGRRYWTTLVKFKILFPKNVLKLMQLKLFCFCDPCRFGNPFILYLERTVTWDVLQKEILEKMRHLLRPGVFVQVHCHYIHTEPLILITFEFMFFKCLVLDGLQVGPFTLRVVGVVGITYLLPQEEQPLCHPSVER